MRLGLEAGVATVAARKDQTASSVAAFKGAARTLLAKCGARRAPAGRAGHPPPLMRTPHDFSRLSVGAQASAQPSRRPGASILDQLPRETTRLGGASGSAPPLLPPVWALLLPLLPPLPPLPPPPAPLPSSGRGSSPAAAMALSTARIGGGGSGEPGWVSSW